MHVELADAVQPDAWYRELPRPQYAALPLVDQPEKWFSVYRLPGDVFAIYEPGHFQEVISFLILGAQRALLLDTGMGIGNIRSVTDFLCPLPLDVVISHTHFDHIGDNWRYDRVHVFDHPAALQRMREGLSREEVAENMREGSNAVAYPAEFDPASYHIRPCRFQPVPDGHIFDLGGRALEVLHTPGHSPDSIMLADRENRLLFTGDSVYPATLYAHLDLPGGLRSVTETYRDSIARLSAPFADYQLICSHNEPLRPGSLLGDVGSALSSILSGSVPFQTDRSGLKKYTFDGFCVVTQ